MALGALGGVVVVVIAVLLIESTGTQQPFAFSPEKIASFERYAAAGESHLLYANSPGGAIATARRVSAFQGPIAAAARAARIDPQTLEGVVFLESGGQPDVIVGGDPANAAGIAQILPDTGRQLLGMHVDLAASRRLTAQINAATRQHQGALVARLERQRRSVDERFDPQKALAATGRYLNLAQSRFGRSDFAVESYHMGIGNLTDAIRAYVGPKEKRPAKTLVQDQNLSYAQLYFESTPFSHQAAYRLLAALGDDSATYLWRVLAARDIMVLYRQNPGQLEQLNDLQTRYGSGEAVLHPPGTTPTFNDPQALRKARSQGALVSVPDQPAKLHFALDPNLQAQVLQLGGDPSLYTTLRPEALATLYYIGDRVHAISGARQPLFVAGAVRDSAYEASLLKSQSHGVVPYSLYTTGYSFDITRRYESHAQAEAFQWTLDRLQALDVIAWEPRGGVIHITVSNQAKGLLPILNGAKIQD